jgi:hypothetical protein
MALTINRAPATPKPALKKKRQTHALAQMPTFSLNEPGHKVRVGHFLFYLGYKSHSSFYEWIEKGLVPKTDGRDPRPFWWSETVKAYWHVLMERYKYSVKKRSKLNFS